MQCNRAERSGKTSILCPFVVLCRSHFDFPFPDLPLQFFSSLLSVESHWRANVCAPMSYIFSAFQSPLFLPFARLPIFMNMIFLFFCCCSSSPLCFYWLWFFFQLPVCVCLQCTLPAHTHRFAHTATIAITIKTPLTLFAISIELCFIVLQQRHQHSLTCVRHSP